jgi:hypothetical protein
MRPERGALSLPCETYSYGRFTRLRGVSFGQSLTNQESAARPRDPSQLAKLIVDIAIRQVEDKHDPRLADSAKDPAAV